MFKCPYCQQDSYAKSSKKKGKFESWKPIQRHVAKCTKSDKSYFIDSNVGPIHYLDLQDKRRGEIHNNFPNLKNLSNIRRSLKQRNIKLNFITNWTKETIINAIQSFIKQSNGKFQARDFRVYKDGKLPDCETIAEHFGTFNAGIKAAGFEPDYNDGFGTRTIANDEILYRSKAEAYFVNNYLYGKYKYEYERKYDNHNKYYDFYLPELDLYIELDGGLRPQVIEEKILINKQENKKLLILTSNDIYNKIICFDDL